MASVLQKFRAAAPKSQELEDEKLAPYDAQTLGMATPGMATPTMGSLHGHGFHSQAPSLHGMTPSSINESNDSYLQRQTAYEIMAETLFRYAQRARLFSDNPMVWNGVALRLAKGRYVCSPQYDPRLQPWVQALALLNVTVSTTIPLSFDANY